jgi:membrane associated rhomboid family serine protease
MFLPIGDSPNPPGTPWMTCAIITANVVVYLLLLPAGFQPPDGDDPALLDYLRMIAEERDLSRPEMSRLVERISAYDLIVYRHGFRPAEPAIADMFTSMFLHGGLLHLLGNMLFLWIYGDNIEHRLGRLRFLLAYLGTGAVAALGDGLIRAGSGIPSVGASGAISGVLGLYFLWFPRNRVRVWVFLFPFLADVWELPARLVLGFYILFNNIVPLLLSAGSGGVSYGAHIGGFVAGAALAFAGDRFIAARPEADVRRRPAGVPPVVAADVAGRFRQAMQEGRWDLAAELYFTAPHVLTRQLLGPWEKIALGHELERHDHPKAALAAYQRALGDHPGGPGRAAAHLGAARVMMGRMGNPTGAYQHLYAAMEEGPTPEERAQARSLLGDLARMVRSVPRHTPQ